MANKKQCRDILKPRFSERLIKAMDDRGLTAQTLSDSMNKKHKELFGIESGSFVNTINSWRSNSNAVIPGADYMYLLAVVLDCDMEYLLGVQEVPRKTIEIAAETVGLSVDTMQNISKFYDNSKKTIDILSNSNSFNWFLYCLYANVKEEVDSKKDNKWNLNPARKSEERIYHDLSPLEYHSLMTNCEDAIKHNIPDLIHGMVEHFIKE